MKNQLIPQLFIFTALECEAKPLVKYFDLKKRSVISPFSIYQNNEIVLTVTGVGKVAMAGAVAYTLALFPGQQIPALVNIGIAGHKTEAIGSLLLAAKIVDVDSGKRFYPQLVGSDWPETCEIKTASIPCDQYSPGCLNDMEASAFYEMAVRFSSSELIHCIKVVSDNEQSSLQKIQSKLVTEWIANQTIEIECLLKNLLTLRSSIAPIELDEYWEIVEKWHFTVSGKIKLKALLMRWKILSSEVWFSCNEANLKSGKEVLKKLEADVGRLEVYL